LSEVTYEVSDLVDDQPQLETLAQIIRQMVKPASWQEAGGSGLLSLDEKSIVVKNSHKAQFQVLGLCEKLRVARGLAPRGGLGASSLHLTPKHSLAAAKLSKGVELNFIRPVPLAQLFQRLERQTRVRIIVDWRGLASAGWSPEASIPLTVEKLPLVEVLKKLLSPMDLMFRTIDATTLQISSLQTLQNWPELEFYDAQELLAEDPTGKALVERLRTSLGAQLFQDAGGVGALQFDAPSKHLLAYLPQSRQIELAKILAEWKAKK